MSAIGEHAYATTDWTVRAGIVKAFNVGPGPLKAAHPKAALFYRKYVGDFNPDADGAGIARRTIADLGTFRAPGRLWIELFVGPDQQQLAGLEAQIRAAIPVCRAAGVGLAACSWYTGQPEPSVWAQMRDHGWYGLDPDVDCISVQEYTSTGTLADPVNVGRFTALLDAGWTGRVAILEAGMDVNGTPGGGWIGRLTLDQFYAYLHGYDALLAQHPQVIGAAVFNAPGWPSFEFHDPRGQFNYSEGAPTMPNFNIGPGFAAKIAERGWTPAGDEVYFAVNAAAKYSMVECVEGLLWYSSASNKVGVLPFS